MSLAIKRVKEAISQIQQGNMIVMIDDEDRENEGDLVYPASLSTPQKVNFLVTHARGLVCVALSKENANRLELNPMVSNNNSSYETAFTVSVDAKTASTGISAKERDDTIKILANPLSTPQELVRPGHIFPLIAKDGGVLVRTGHTEGSVDICNLAGLNGGAVICEIMNEDGSMARRDDLDNFAKEHNLSVVYISDIVEYRLAYESLLSEVKSFNTNLLGSKVEVKEFKDHLNNIHKVFIFNQITSSTNVKFHTITDDVELFENNKIQSMLKAIDYLKENSGVLIFLNTNNEDRSAQMKDFGVGAQILNKLGIKEINLLTSSISNISFVGIGGFGLSIKEEITF